MSIKVHPFIDENVIAGGATQEKSELDTVNPIFAGPIYLSVTSDGRIIVSQTSKYALADRAATISKSQSDIGIIPSLCGTLEVVRFERAVKALTGPGIEESEFRDWMEKHIKDALFPWDELAANMQSDECSAIAYADPRLLHRAIADDREEFVNAAIFDDPARAFIKLRCDACDIAGPGDGGCSALKCAMIHDAYTSAAHIINLYTKIFTSPTGTSDFDGASYLEQIDVSHIIDMIEDERYVTDALDMFVAIPLWPQDKDVLDCTEVFRVDMESQGLTKGSTERCPLGFWAQDSDVKLSPSGSYVEVFVVPLKGAAARLPNFLSALIAATKICRGHRHLIFGNEVVETLVDFKWYTYVRRQYIFDGCVHVLWWALFHVNGMYFAKDYMRDRDHTHTTIAAVLGCSQVLFYMYFVVHEGCDFITTITDRQNVYSLALSVYRYCFNIWNAIDVALLLTVLVASVSQFAILLMQPFYYQALLLHVMRYFRISVAVAMPLFSLKVLFFMQGDHHTAALIRMIKKITQNTLIFAVILLIICVGYASGFTLLFEREVFHDEFDGYSSFDKALVSVFAFMFGDFDISVMHDAYSPQTALLLLFTFLVFVGLILLNLLIAIMGNKYEEINENKHPESIYSRALIVAEYERVISLKMLRYNEPSWFPAWIQKIKPKQKLPRLRAAADRMASIARDARHAVRENVEFNIQKLQKLQANLQDRMR